MVWMRTPRCVEHAREQPARGAHALAGGRFIGALGTVRTSSASGMDATAPA
jgi:hypothetical protein